MRSWYALLIRSCIDDWTLARMMVAWLYAYVLCSIFFHDYAFLPLEKS